MHRRSLLLVNISFYTMHNTKKMGQKNLGVWQRKQGQKNLVGGKVTCSPSFKWNKNLAKRSILQTNIEMYKYKQYKYLQGKIFSLQQFLDLQHISLQYRIFSGEGVAHMTFDLQVYMNTHYFALRGGAQAQGGIPGISPSVQNPAWSIAYHMA